MIGEAEGGFVSGHLQNNPILYVTEILFIDDTFFEVFNLYGTHGKKRMEIAIIESERKKSQLTLTVHAWRLYGEMIYKAVIIWQYRVITAVKPGIQLDQVVTKNFSDCS